MYLEFYNFKHKPFQISTDPRFLWLGEKHREAFATLRYGLHDNKGFLLLTGDVGTGKTTLINALLSTLDRETTHIAFIRDPGLTPLDFFQYTAHCLGMDASEITGKTIFLIEFERFLNQAYTNGQKVLLIIDEAQRLNQTLLEEIRLLSNLEREDNKLVNIFFVGQTEFNDILVRNANRAIRQRITVHYNLEVLDREETVKYIQHRLRVSSSEESFGFFSPLGKTGKGDVAPAGRGIKLPEIREEIFTTEAMQAVYTFSKGYPRVINTICDRALLTGFVEETKPITRDHIEECARELQIPGDAEATVDPRRYGFEEPYEELEYADHLRSRSAASSLRQQQMKRREPPQPTAHATPRTADPISFSSISPAGEGRGFTAEARPPEPPPPPPRASVSDRAEMQELLRKVERLEELARKYQNGDPLEQEQHDSVEPEVRGRRRRSSKRLVVPFFAVVLIALIAVGFGSDLLSSFPQVERFFQRLQESARPLQPPGTAPPRADTLPYSPTRAPAKGQESLPGLKSITLIFPGEELFPSDEALASLREIYWQAENFPDRKVIITYSSPATAAGSPEKTLTLSRANSIKSYLVGKGLEPSRIVLNGDGEAGLATAQLRIPANGFIVTLL